MCFTIMCMTVYQAHPLQRQYATSLFLFTYYFIGCVTAALVATLDTHGGVSSEVAQNALLAITNLTAKNADNARHFGEAGVAKGVCVCVHVCVNVVKHRWVC